MSTKKESILKTTEQLKIKIADMEETLKTLGFQIRDLEFSIKEEVDVH